MQIGGSDQWGNIINGIELIKKASASNNTNVHAITVDSNNNIYFTENGVGKIYKVDPFGNLSFIAGSTSGFQDGIGNISQFDRPLGIAVNNTGEIFISDYGNNRIRKIFS